MKSNLARKGQNIIRKWIDAAYTILWGGAGLAETLFNLEYFYHHYMISN